MSEGGVPSKCTFGLRLPRRTRGPCATGTRPHSEAIPHAPRVAYPQKRSWFRAISHAPRVVYVELPRELFTIFRISFSLYAHVRSRVLLVRCALGGTYSI